METAAEYYSESYTQARHRFREAAALAGATLDSYYLQSCGDDDLSIDVAIVGEDSAPSVLVSSGIHGVEGYFGSAVQLALLDRLCYRHNGRVRYVLVHAINPFGFFHGRRFNEDNVDLNRNFPSANNTYSGAPAGYGQHYSLLNPEHLPPRVDLFKLFAVWRILRYGFESLKEAVASGQYEYPQGLFYGGQAPCESTRIVTRHCAQWIGQSSRVLHMDLHTGLGRYAGYKLLINECSNDPLTHWYVDTFGAESIESLGQAGGTAYRVTGVFGEWIQRQFANIDYRYIGAEFGTYDVLKVLAALRAENCLHHHGGVDAMALQAARSQLFKCFCPPDRQWRITVLESALQVLARAEETTFFKG